jgi:hypothetical protein
MVTLLSPVTRLRGLRVIERVKGGPAGGRNGADSLTIPELNRNHKDDHFFIIIILSIVIRDIIIIVIIIFR